MAFNGEPADPTVNQQPANEGDNAATTGSSWGWRDLALGAAVGTAAVAATPVVLSAAGFTAGGIAVGSAAASVQSVLYGSTVASGSIFAALQSAGVAGISTTASGIIAGTTGTAAVFMKKVGERWFWRQG
ncbi:uncharacterized protein [Porites lutea]|uniref:uncharacterized protein n=1 Tax=Porites lutea TaxID=51062 RepID=UPI003CC67053